MARTGFVGVDNEAIGIPDLDPTSQRLYSLQLTFHLLREPLLLCVSHVPDLPCLADEKYSEQKGDAKRHHDDENHRNLLQPSVRLVLAHDSVIFSKQALLHLACASSASSAELAVTQKAREKRVTY